MLSERPLKSADQKMERVKILNPEYSICRDQPTSRASPLRINDLLSTCGGLDVDYDSERDGHKVCNTEKYNVRFLGQLHEFVSVRM